MKKLYYAALLYTILGLAGGLFYRELTHLNNFAGDTQLAVVHTHFLVLGMVFFLGVIVFEKVFTLSSSKLFNWFSWTYNVGLIWTGAFLTFNGINTVLGNSVSPAVAGISGMGHILLTLALVLFFICLKPFLFGEINKQQQEDMQATRHLRVRDINQQTANTLS